uniref:Uncharacterized protein n=1 Tax=Fagus sylvatica TaxID=28930 RepID=A0A2N9IVS8_FAGSY
MKEEKMAYKMMNQDFVKLDKFDGSNFIRWQDKMKFLLTALKIFYVLDLNLQPILDPTPQDTEQLKQQRIKREEDELVCKGHILNTLSDRLYDLFTTMTSPKEIWKALETKYKMEKQGTDKFIIQKYFDFKMMDNVSVLDQMHELQILVHKLNDLSIKIPELFQVGAIITKLPPSWNNYRKKLLHMAEELTLEQIGTRIEEESRIREVHMANAAENSSEWWYDSGATIHVCNKLLFKEYVEAGNGLEVLMGNHNTTKVLGTGKVELILSSGKKLVLTNVYHVPDLKKNLVSTSLLFKNGVKAVLEILSKKIQSSPYELWNGRKPNLNYLKVWGCIAYFRVSDPKRTKLGPRAIKSVFVRLVAKGFRQREGIDYFDTYAPVARITSIRMLIAFASIYKLVVHQMDVKTAFLNGDLDEEVYMDQPEGFVLPGNEKKVCVCETKKYLVSVFKMKDLNEADTILGYQGQLAQLEFASAIGSMMYVMHCTRPDIAFAVNRLSRYTSNSSAEHWKAIARVLGYLKKTKDLGLYYSGYPAVLEGYSDANWVTSVGDNKSTSGWIFTLGGGAISWASKKQSCISHSTMESEFIALVSAGKEAEWLRNMLYDIELWPQPMSAISIYCDSQATMSKAYSKIYNGKSRHISLRHEYVRQLIEDGVISIVYVKSSGNLADLVYQRFISRYGKGNFHRNGTKTFLKESPTVGTQP